MNRRTFLAGGATAVAAVSGGCSAFRSNGPEGVVPTHVELGNHADESREFDVLVLHDGDIVHWSAHGVDGGEGEVVEIDAPEEYGSVEVHVRVGQRRASTDFGTDRYDGERVIAVVAYGMAGEDSLRISRLVADRTTDDE